MTSLGVLTSMIASGDFSAERRQEIERIISEEKKSLLRHNVYNLKQAITNLDSRDLENASECLFYQLLTRNYEEFERHYNRLQYFYKDLEKKITHSSQERDHIQAIYMLYLITFNRIKEFHLHLQSIPYEKHSNPLFSYTISLERDLTIGNYSLIVNREAAAPSKFFSLFLDRISETIRHEILHSIEMSTSSISLTDALRMFRMKNSEELSAFLHASTQRFSERGVEWYINGDRVFINKIVKKDHQIDTDAVIRKLLEYSYEIETHI